jgi:pyruvate/2-oxoglutarate dehydrogenase complex dihydrolipoamide acyltransferase (E2) component
VESEKASIEIPASHGGVVTERKVKLGDKVKEGSVVVLLEAAGAASDAIPVAAPAASAPAATATVPAPVASSFCGSGDLECVVDSNGALALKKVPKRMLILGGGMLSTQAGDMIGEIALAIEMDADAVAIGRTIHPHPTLGEGAGMAAEIAHGSCTDVPPQKSKQTQCY